MAAALLAALLSTAVTRAAVHTFTAELAPADPGPAGASGSAVVTVDDETNEICFELSVDGIASDDTITRAFINGEGPAADVVITLFAEPPTGEMTGCVQGVDAALVAEIVANPSAWYVNIATEAFPAAALRGPLTVEATADCTVTVEPTAVRVGEQFVVSGNFGGAEIYFVPGENASPPEEAEPAATVPADQDSFSVSFTAQAGDEGTWTIWAVIPASECGDSAILTIGAAASLPDVAMPPGHAPGADLAAVLLAALALLGLIALRLRASALR